MSANGGVLRTACGQAARGRPLAQASPVSRKSAAEALDTDRVAPTVAALLRLLPAKPMATPPAPIGAMGEVFNEAASSERFARQAFQVLTTPPGMETDLPGDNPENRQPQPQMPQSLSIAEVLDNCSVEVLEAVRAILNFRRSN